MTLLFYQLVLHLNILLTVLYKVLIWNINDILLLCMDLHLKVVGILFGLICNLLSHHRICHGAVLGTLMLFAINLTKLVVVLCDCLKWLVLIILFKHVLWWKLLRKELISLGLISNLEIRRFNNGLIVLLLMLLGFNNFRDHMYFMKLCWNPIIAR